MTGSVITCGKVHAHGLVIVSQVSPQAMVSQRHELPINKEIYIFDYHQTETELDRNSRHTFIPI